VGDVPEYGMHFKRQYLGTIPAHVLFRPIVNRNGIRKHETLDFQKRHVIVGVHVKV